MADAAGYGYYGLALVLGGILGASEIVSRYRDDPAAAVRTPAAGLYIGLNAAASFAAFYLVRSVPFLNMLGGSGNEPGNPLMQALLAGLSAMALFRSSLFTMRVGNADIPIGPAAFLQILLFAADRATDRARARPRGLAVNDIMKGVSFALAEEALPALCFGLMQGLTAEDQAAFGLTVNALKGSRMYDSLKA